MNPILVVFKKEIREMFRDKRVISGAFLGPIILIVFMLMLFGFIGQAVDKPSISKIGVLKGGESPKFVTELAKALEAKLVVIPELEKGKEQVRDGDIKLFLTVNSRTVAGKQVPESHIVAYLDRNETIAVIAAKTLEGAVSAANTVAVKEVLKSQNLTPDLAAVFLFEQKDESKGKGLGGSMIVSLLPYLIIIWAFYGGFSIVSDLVAGEKERGTLETLLISPVSRSQIAWGKFMALGLVCLMSSLSSLLGVILIGILPTNLAHNLFPDGIKLGLVSILTIGAVLIPLVVFFAGLLLAISAYAKNMRECQTYLTLVSFVVLLPAIFSQFIGFTDLGKSKWILATPILNSSMVIRQALLNQVDGQSLLICVAVSLVLGLLMLRVVVGLFQREAILSRT